MTPARIARRLVRKLAKPVALWLTTRALHRAEARAESYAQAPPSVQLLEREERIRAVKLMARRNQIAGW